MGVQLPSEPITRKEQYLAKAAGQAVEIPAEPITREEAYLEAIANAGGGGGGTNNYNDLSNQPQINNHTLTGNKTASDLGLVAAENGKGLSSNDYTDADKAIVGGVTAALADKADKSAVKNEFIGTLEQWNALTEEQKKAYDTYQITDDYTQGSGLPNYSTTEQKTGQKWIDGKDIYFRVLELQSAVTLNSNQWINLGVDIPISTGIQAYAIASDGTNVPICLAYDSTVGVQVLSMRTASIAFSTFILYYTKTA